MKHTKYLKSEHMPIFIVQKWFYLIIAKESLLSNVARIECWLVGSYNSMSHSTSTVLRLYSGSFLLHFSLFPLFFDVFPLFFFAYFLCFSSIFSIFLLGSSIFSVYLSQLYQQATDPTYEQCYVPRVYVPSSADRFYVGSRSWLCCF